MYARPLLLVIGKLYGEPNPQILATLNDRRMQRVLGYSCAPDIGNQLSTWILVCGVPVHEGGGVEAGCAAGR